MKIIKTIFIPTLLLCLAGCAKEINSSSTPQLAKNHKSLTESGNSSDSVLHKILLGNHKGLIRVSRYISSGRFYSLGETKVTYGVFGAINDHTTGQNYEFSIGNSCKRKAEWNKAHNNYSFKNTQEQFDKDDFSDLYGQTASFSLKLNGENLFEGSIETPDTILTSPIKMIGRYPRKNPVNINWNKSSSPNNIGTVVIVSAHEEFGLPPVGQIYDIFPDASNTQDISYLFENFPDQKHFFIQVMRGNYSEITLKNGDVYDIIVYTESTNNVLFPQDGHGKE